MTSGPTTTGPGAALEARGVRHAYGRRTVLAGADLAVPRGATVALLGPNGSGKTTLLRIAAGLRLPSAGAVRLADGTPSHLAVLAGRIAYVPQQLGLVRHATALQNASMGGLARTPWWRALAARPPPEVADAARKALEDVGLSRHADTLVRELSGGERQRVAVARALVQRPEVLVADEITSSLDLNRSRQVLGILDQLREATGCAIVASLHNAAAALEWADYVTILREGTLMPLRRARDVTVEEVGWAFAA